MMFWPEPRYAEDILADARRAKEILHGGPPGGFLNS
jgi:hypothetical protein